MGSRLLRVQFSPSFPDKPATLHVLSIGLSALVASLTLHSAQSIFYSLIITYSISTMASIYVSRKNADYCFNPSFREQIILTDYPPNLLLFKILLVPLLSAMSPMFTVCIFQSHAFIELMYGNHINKILYALLLDGLQIMLFLQMLIEILRNVRQDSSLFPSTLYGYFMQIADYGALAAWAVIAVAIFGGLVSLEMSIILLCIVPLLIFALARVAVTRWKYLVSSFVDRS